MIAPGLLRIGQSATLTDAAAQRIAAATDLHRLIEPTEIAALTIALLSRTTGPITGQVIRADGAR
jgi:NAD(P)-dependent dehydrogenase (short-subunit alcohol dehydrogenase family)